MSLSLFAVIVALIFISALVYLFASLLVVEYMFYRAKQVQAEVLESFNDDDTDLDQHAADNPDMQFYQS